MKLFELRSCGVEERSALWRGGREFDWRFGVIVRILWAEDMKMIVGIVGIVGIVRIVKTPQLEYWCRGCEVVRLRGCEVVML